MSKKFSGEPIRPVFKDQESTKRRQGITTTRCVTTQKIASSRLLRGGSQNHTSNKEVWQTFSWSKFRVSECLIVLFAGLNSRVAVFYYILSERTYVRTRCMHKSGHALYR